MKIKNTIEYMKDLMNMTEKEVLTEFNFEKFIGAPNTDKLFHIRSSDMRQWVIESAQFPKNQFGYVSCDTYIPIQDCLQDIDDYEFKNKMEEYGITVDDNEYFSLFKDEKIDCDGKTFDETKDELENAYVSMYCDGHTGEVGVYIGKDGLLHSYIFGSNTYLNPNVCDHVLFQEGRSTSFEKLYNIDDWDEIEDENVIKEIIEKNDIEDSELLFEDGERTSYSLWVNSEGNYMVKDRTADDWWENDFNFCW